MRLFSWFLYDVCEIETLWLWPEARLHCITKSILLLMMVDTWYWCMVWNISFFEAMNWIRPYWGKYLQTDKRIYPFLGHTHLTPLLLVYSCLASLLHGPYPMTLLFSTLKVRPANWKTYLTNSSVRYPHDNTIGAGN